MTMVAARRHLFLAGFMGTGKSAVGAALAVRLGWPFVDLDTFVESLRRRTIVEIFRLEGEAAFRQHEAKAMRLVLGSPPTVIALGGGAPTVPAIARMVRQTGRTVLLTATWETIWQRMRAQTDSRPLLSPIGNASGDETTGDQATQLARFVEHADPILRSRLDPYMRIADLAVDTSALTIPQVVERIWEWVGGAG